MTPRRTSRSRGAAIVVITACAVAALYVLLAPTASAAGTLAQTATASVPDVPDCAGDQTSTLEGIDEDATPVVVVHGWNGAAMGDTRTLLADLAGPRAHHLLFDYTRASNQWADAPAVAGCLALYLTAVHAAAGGDSPVYVVAHSMGGLATRFAVAQDPNLGDMLGGLVTLNTPHTGSPWGNTAWTRAMEGTHLGGFDPVPGGTALARRCLAVHAEGRGLPRGCTVAPYLPGTIGVHTVAGNAVIERTFFGFHAYDIHLGGDSIVAIDSQHGYPGSAPGPRTGHRLSTSTVSCSGTDGQILATAGRMSGGGAAVAAGALAQLAADSAAMDAILGNRTDGALALLMAVNLTLPCTHARIGTHTAALTEADRVIAEWVAEQPPPTPEGAPPRDQEPGYVLTPEGMYPFRLGSPSDGAPLPYQDFTTSDAEGSLCWSAHSDDLATTVFGQPGGDIFAVQTSQLPTQEGVAPGDTRADILAAYPGARTVEGGIVVVDMPGPASYAFGLDAFDVPEQPTDVVFSVAVVVDEVADHYEWCA